MTTDEAPSPAGRRARSPFIGTLVVALTALVGVLALQAQGSMTTPSRAAVALTSVAAGPPTIPVPPPGPGAGGSDGQGVDDGAVPDGTTVFDEDVPAVARLDPALLQALRRVAGEVDLVVNSGWRSATYQERLLEQAVLEHGSREAAARWVATPATSAHVAGDAVDIGPTAAARWVSDHGAAYGLCQIYRNEPWHFELRSEAADAGCPAMYADATKDPRLQG